MVSNSFAYLDIKITPKIDNLVSANYNPVIESVTESINRWSLLPISTICRINIVKTKVRPKFLYLFQSIPLRPPSQFFAKIKKMFCKFVWNNRRARLCLSLLYLHYERGGLTETSKPSMVLFGSPTLNCLLLAFARKSIVLGKH